jgi:uncharacterized protein (TIGR03083 family)
MTTPPYPDLVAVVRREGEGLISAARMDLDAPVATCGEWTLGDLVAHVSQIYANVGFFVANRVRSRPDLLPSVPPGDPIEVLSGLLDALVAALSGSEADTPVWAWVFNQPEGARFWARRMAHESSIHRFDAEAAHGILSPIDPDLAPDELDELIDVLAPRVYSRDALDGPSGTVVLASSDNGAWSLELTPGGIVRIDQPRQPDVTVRGTTSALVLASYSRVPWAALNVDGDAGLLSRWTTTMSF